jgi:hypothetical protein
MFQASPFTEMKNKKKSLLQVSSLSGEVNPKSQIQNPKSVDVQFDRG